MNGKGSARRPAAVSDAQIEDAWKRIFRKDGPTLEIPCSCWLSASHSVGCFCLRSPHTTSSTDPETTNDATPE